MIRRRYQKAKGKYVERFAATTPGKNEELEDRHKKLIQIFSRHRFDRILDIGCGDGNFSILLKRACQAKEVYGVEISQKGVDCARANGVNVTQLDIDDEDFPFDSDFFDAIFAGEILEHLFDPDHCLTEIHRVLARKGLCVITTPNLASIHNRLALLLGYQPFCMGVSARTNMGRIYEPDSSQSLDHIRVLTLRSLKKLLEVNRFEIVEVKGSCAKLPPQMRFSKIIRGIDKVFTLFPALSYRTILVAKKG